MTRREFVRQAGKVSTVVAAGVILGDVSGTPKQQVSPKSDVVMMTAGELSQAIHARQVSCQEVMTAYLAHIEALNPKDDPSRK